jgi:hypothetical protein
VTYRIVGGVIRVVNGVQLRRRNHQNYNGPPSPDLTNRVAGRFGVRARLYKFRKRACGAHAFWYRDNERRPLWP